MTPVKDIAFSILIRHPDLFQDDVSLNELIVDIAQAIEKERNEMDDMRAFVGHVVIAAGGSVAVPMANLRRCRYPRITRQDRTTPDDILLTATLDDLDSQGTS